MFQNKLPPEQFYKKGFAIATALLVPAYYLTKSSPTTRYNSWTTENRQSTLKQPPSSSFSKVLNKTPQLLLRTRSADGVMIQKLTKNEKLKLIILRLLKSPHTKSSITAIEALDKALNQIASETKELLDIHQWREQFRQLVLLGLTRATQMQSYSTVNRLLTIYDGIPHSGEQSNGHEMKQIETSRNLLRSRVSTQWKQLGVLVNICGIKAFLWLIIGGGVGAISGSVSQLFNHYFGLIQSAAFEGRTSKTFTAALAALASQLILQLLDHLGSECVSRGGKTIQRSLQGQLFERLMMASCSYHDYLPSGAKAALLKETSDLQSDLFEKPIQICRILGELIPMYSIVTKMSLPSLLVSCVVSPILGWISGRAALRASRVHRAITRLNTSRNITDQMILGSHFKSVRSNTDESHEIQRYHEYLSHHETLEKELLKAQTWSEGARYLKQMSSITLLVLMSDMVRKGTLKSSEISGYSLQIWLAWSKLETLYEHCGSFWQSFEPAGRVMAALSLKGENEESARNKGKKTGNTLTTNTSLIHSPNTSPKSSSKKIQEGVGITFENVWFSYPLRANDPVLKGISFSIQPGTSAAIVGPSGSGKSTIMALLERFYSPSEGSIIIDGQNIQIMNVKKHRERISYVSQDACIFPRTVRENIIMGGRHLYKDCNDEILGESCDNDVIDALKTANAWEFCNGLPDGLHTWIVSGGGSGNGADTFNSLLNLSKNGDNSCRAIDVNGGEGINEEEAGNDRMGLSGGQSARIGIARAIMRKAPILLLDEAFSNLDAKSERIIQLELKKISKKQKKTVIAISHQLESLDWVDQIIVLQNGEVHEIGTYQQLSSKVNGIFASMLRQKKS